MDNKLRITPAAVSAAARGDIENFLVAAIPGGIERQEAAGQAALVGIFGILPKQCPRAQLESLGFVFGTPADDLFVNVTFPAGWSKKATDHLMWSDLLDDKGRKRGAIFYKAAFYDRSSHMHLECRYTSGTQYLNSDLTPFQWGGNSQPSKQRAAVIDQADGSVLFHSEAWPDGKWELGEKPKENADAWLKENFPDHGDPLAYW